MNCGWAGTAAWSNWPSMVPTGVKRSKRTPCRSTCTQASESIRRTWFWTSHKNTKVNMRQRQVSHFHLTMLINAYKSFVPSWAEAVFGSPSFEFCIHTMYNIINFLQYINFLRCALCAKLCLVFRQSNLLPLHSGIAINATEATLGSAAELHSEAFSKKRKTNSFQPPPPLVQKMTMAPNQSSTETSQPPPEGSHQFISFRILTWNIRIHLKL